jgi:hypothetical protein
MVVSWIVIRGSEGLLVTYSGYLVVSFQSLRSGPDSSAGFYTSMTGGGSGLFLG